MKMRRSLIEILRTNSTPELSSKIIENPEKSRTPTEAESTVPVVLYTNLQFKMTFLNGMWVGSPIKDTSTTTSKAETGKQSYLSTQQPQNITQPT